MDRLSTEEMTAVRGGYHKSHQLHRIDGKFIHKFTACNGVANNCVMGNGIANNSAGIANNSAGISNSFNNVSVIPQGGEIDFGS